MGDCKETLFSIHKSSTRNHSLNEGLRVMFASSNLNVEMLHQGCAAKWTI